jgi:AcrR family transcriptional regulator
VRKDPVVRRDEILRASRELFSRRSFGGVSMGDIADSCGLGRSSVYEYFAGKEDILVALVDDVVERAHAIKISGTTTRERLESAAEALLRVIEDDRDVYALIFREASALDPKLTGRFLRWRRLSEDYARKVLACAGGDDSESLRPGISRGEAAFGFAALVSQHAGDALLSGSRIRPASDARRLVKLLWQGIGRSTRA